MNHPNSRQRRRLLQAATGTAILSAFAGAPTMAIAQSPGPRVTQLLDMSPDQQELSRDYATGVRLAFAELKKANAPVPQLYTVETDGTPLAARNAVQLVKNDPAQVALLGTVGEGLALATLNE